jgi:hypothetical protein
MNHFKKQQIQNIADFNPREQLAKGALAKSVPMAMLKEFQRQITGYEIKAFNGGAKFRNGDTLLAKITPCLENGKTAFVDILDDGEVAFGSTEFIVLRAKNETNPEFLYYFAISPDFRKRAIECMEGTSGRQRVNENTLETLELPIPEPQTQKSIAAILSALDKKIALNKQINARLEEMAKTLYDYWFVQFDFPDANGKPYKSSGGDMVFDETLKREIPKGWEPFKLSELVTLSTGKEDANFATEQGIYPFFTCSEKILKCDVYSFDTQAILLAGNGTFSVKRFTGRFNAYQRTYVLEPKSKNLYPIVYFVIIDNVIKFTSGSRGSIIKFITRGDIEHIDVVLPNDIENMRFSEVLYTYLLQAELLEKQNHQLTQLRDFLLPMLMNGQVSVAE